MARARFIRPEFFTDEKVGELPFAARLLFAGSWIHADLNGVLEWRPKQLRALIFPHDENVKSGDVEKWMKDIERARLVRVFVAQAPGHDGQEAGEGAATYALIVNFHKHQSLTESEIKSGARFPVPQGFEPLSPRKRGGHSVMERKGPTDAVPAPPPECPSAPPGALAGASPAVAVAPAPAPSPAPDAGLPPPARESPPPAAAGALALGAAPGTAATANGGENGKLRVRLGRFGMAASPQATIEWAGLLRERAGITHWEYVDEFLGHCARLGRVAGEPVRYAREAIAMADDWRAGKRPAEAP